MFIYCNSKIILWCSSLTNVRVSDSRVTSSSSRIRKFVKFFTSHKECHVLCELQRRAVSSRIINSGDKDCRVLEESYGVMTSSKVMNTVKSFKSYESGHVSVCNGFPMHVLSRLICKSASSFSTGISVFDSTTIGFTQLNLQRSLWWLVMPMALIAVPTESGQQHSFSHPWYRYRQFDIHKAHKIIHTAQLSGWWSRTDGWQEQKKAVTSAPLKSYTQPFN